MDWSIFIPTLLATFAGVLLSIGLSLLVRSLVNRYKAKGQRATTKHVLSLEIADTLGRLKSVRTGANNVINGNSNIQTLCSPASTLRTSAYNDAFKRGEIYRLGNSTLEEALMRYAWRCENFNNEIRWIGEIVKEKFGFGVVPLAIARAHLQPRLPVIDELINRGYELLKMMNEDLGESDTPSE
jgi:hypothetical protein